MEAAGPITSDTKRSTARFSNRVENYVRYRPHYPKEVLEYLKQDCALRTSSIIADIGSGTGFLAEQFLENGNQVFGVEPNREMREAGERLLQNFPRFKSIDAPAEQTTLPDASMDFILAGQAFHWFDRERCRLEFSRILRPPGWVVLVWNDRKTETTPFLRDYEKLLHTYGTDYAKVDHKQVDENVLKQFYGIAPMLRKIPNYQHFDLAALTGRLLSSSYVPAENEPGYSEMMNALKNLFEMHENNGLVTLEYDTLLFYGRFAERAG